MGTFFECNLSNISTVQLASQFFVMKKKSLNEYLEHLIYTSYYLKSKTFHSNIFDPETLNKVDHFPMPKVLQAKLKCTIRYMELQLTRWLKNNIRILKWDLKLFPDFLRWTQWGKVDIPKTIDNILQSKRIHVYHKFLISSKFCCKKEISMLWNQLSLKDKQAFRQNRDRMSPYWRYALKSKMSTDFKSFVPDAIAFKDLVKEAMRKNNILAVKYFWKYLSFRDKYDLFNSPAMTDDLVFFVLSRCKIPEYLMTEKIAFNILKASFDNWLWHDETLVHLQTYQHYISDVDMVNLYSHIVNKIELYPLKSQLKDLLRKTQRVGIYDIAPAAFSKFLIRLMRMEDFESFKLFLDNLSTYDKYVFLHSHENPVPILMESKRFDVLDHLLELSFETDEQLAAFKKRFFTQINIREDGGVTSFSLQILKAGNLEMYIAIQNWTSLSEESWGEFKKHTLLNESRYHILREVLLQGGVSVFCEYMNLLFPSPIELADYKQKQLVPNHAGEFFVDILCNKKCIPCFGMVHNFKQAKKFLEFCFPHDPEQRDAFKKATLNDQGPYFCKMLYDRNLYYKLDEMLQFCSLTLKENMAYKIEMFVENKGRLDIASSLLLNESGFNVYNRIFRECFLTEEEIVCKKKECFWSPFVIETFVKRIKVCHADKAAVLKDAFDWFGLTDDDIAALRLRMEPEMTLKSETVFKLVFKLNQDETGIPPFI